MVRWYIRPGHTTTRTQALVAAVVVLVRRIEQRTARTPVPGAVRSAPGGGVLALGLSLFPLFGSAPAEPRTGSTANRHPQPLAELSRCRPGRSILQASNPGPVRVRPPGPRGCGRRARTSPAAGDGVSELSLHASPYLSSVTIVQEAPCLSIALSGTCSRLVCSIQKFQNWPNINILHRPKIPESPNDETSRSDPLKTPWILAQTIPLIPMISPI